MKRQALVVTSTFVLATALLTACGQINFRRDSRIAIQSPSERSEVTLPFTLKWSVVDFRVAQQVGGSDGGWFVVLVDHEPPRPGQSVSDLARRVPACRIDPACPDDRFLLAAGIRPTVSTELVIDSLKRPKGKARNREFHDISILLVDDRGRRIGENIVTRRVVLDRNMR
jgi:hypothetical protein